MDEYKLADTPLPSPVFNPQDLIGLSFLMEEKSDAQKARGHIVQLNEDHESSLEDNPTIIKFRVVSVHNNKSITKDEESDIMWKFRQIISHTVKGSQITLLIEWENGEMTKEPLQIIACS
jgi:hypothetical protein